MKCKSIRSRSRACEPRVELQYGFPVCCLRVLIRRRPSQWRRRSPVLRSCVGEPCAVAHENAEDEDFELFCSIQFQTVKCERPLAGWLV